MGLPRSIFWMSFLSRALPLSIRHLELGLFFDHVGMGQETNLNPLMIIVIRHHHHHHHHQHHQHHHMTMKNLAIVPMFFHEHTLNLPRNRGRIAVQRDRSDRLS